MSNSIAPKLLILGGPNSGKSTFRGQVLQRFEHRPGALKLLKSIGDIAAVEKDIDRLTRGLQPMHTSSNTYVATDISLIDGSGQRYDLSFADYDGEQLRKLSNGNVLSAPWADRAQLADAWLLFLRIDNVRAVRGFMTHPVQAEPRVAAKSDTSPAAVPVPDGAIMESHVIEMLQRLLFVRGSFSRHRQNTPRLVVLLSCWDELAATERLMAPTDLLANRAPLLGRYLIANWNSDALKIWGLSSTEQALPATVPNKEFARKGPENFGYIVTGAQQQVPDITLPVTWLLQEAK